MKSSDVRPGLECLVYEDGLWRNAIVLGIHKTPGRPGPRRYELQILNGGRKVVREAKKLEPLPLTTPAAVIAEPNEDPVEERITVKRDDEGLYVEIEGRRFSGEDLPEEGTWMLSTSTFTDVHQHRMADVEWSGDTPSGRCQALLSES